MMSGEDAAHHELDLALAAELQAALLPTECPADCPHHVAAARNRMCARVGGDFHDFIRINQDQIALVVGDVVGHGVRASLLMAKIMGYLRSETANRSRPMEMVRAINRTLIDLGEKVGHVLSCTMLYAVIDAPTGTGFFVNAGHCRPFICDRERCSVLHLEPRNLMLGVDEFQPQEACHTFMPGERLVIYTDGIVEASDPDDQPFGEQRLHEVVFAHSEDGPDRCAAGVFEAVDAFRRSARQEDDETIVVVDRV